MSNMQLSMRVQHLMLILHAVGLFLDDTAGQFQPVHNCNAYHSGVLRVQSVRSDIQCGWLCQHDSLCGGYTVARQRDQYVHSTCTMYAKPEYTSPFENQCQFVVGEWQRPLRNLFQGGEGVQGKRDVFMEKMINSTVVDPCERLTQMCCEGVQSAIGCQDKGPISLECSGTGTIYIHEASYGRSRPYSDVCDVDEDESNRSTCSSASANDLITSLCHGEKSCVIEPLDLFIEDDSCNETAKYLNVTYECDCRGEKYWWPVYRHDHSGQPINGSKAQLFADIKDGSLVKIMLYNYFSSMFYYRSDEQIETTAVYIKDHGDLICAQSQPARRKLFWDDFEYPPQKFLRMVCTSGEIQELSVELSMGQYTYDYWGYPQIVEWYTHKPFHPIKLNTSQDINEPMITDAATAVRKGRKASLFIDDVIQRIMYTSTFNVDETIEGDLDVSTLSGHRVNYIDAGYALQLEVYNLYYMFEEVSLLGSVSLMPWYFEQSQAHGNPSVTNEKVTWYLEDAYEWQSVYHHDETGIPITGSLEALTKAFLSGHNIRVMYTSPDSPDRVYVQDVSYLSLLSEQGPIAAQLFGNSRLNVDQGSWGTPLEDLHTVVDTNGNVSVYHQAHTASQLVNLETGPSSITWFADTKRWQLVYIYNNATYGTYDNRSRLIDLINMGAPVKVVVDDQWSFSTRKVEVADEYIVLLESQHIGWYPMDGAMSLTLPLSYVYSVLNSDGWRSYDQLIYGDTTHMDTNRNPENIKWFTFI